MPPDLHWGERTYVMGIVNLTADSFSGDGLAPPGRSTATVLKSAIRRARGFVEAGADIIDVGAESTRPREAYGDHAEVDAAIEASLAVPVVRAIVEAFGTRVQVSIDTSKGSVARAAVEAGAGMVNDVWAARRDPGTADVAAESGAYLVLMHNQAAGVGYPEGIFDTVVRSLRDAAEAAAQRGVRRERLILDPGIGFGKGTEDNLELLHRLAELKSSLDGMPLLVGTSRKRFIGELLGGAAPDDRVEGTAATVALSIAAGADVVRVHDVAAIDRTRRVADAIVRR